MKVRRARPGDLARLQGEPDAEWAAQSPPEMRGSEGDRVLELVAEVHGEVAGALVARVVGAGAESRLRIDYLVTAAAHRGRGYAAQLAEAAEAWGREHGATVAETWTDHRRSVPFWKGRMAYAERSVNLRKPLG